MTALTSKTDQSFTSVAPKTAGQLRFCTRCGEPSARPPLGGTAPVSRVCGSCGLGVMLSCHSEALPGAGAAFMVATADLRISAVSEAAESTFGPERKLLDQPLLGMFTSPMGDDQLARTLSRAAIRPQEPVVMPVRGIVSESSEHGMLAARISTCGPPRGALITVEPSGFGLR